MATQQDRFDALDEESLYRYLTDTATKRCEYLEVEERPDGRVAQIWSEGAGKSQGEWRSPQERATDAQQCCASRVGTGANPYRANRASRTAQDPTASGAS